MKSSIVKRSVTLDGHRTSVSLEEAFLKALREVALHQHVTATHLIEIINANRNQGNLSSAIRLFVLELYQDQIDHVALRPPDPSKPSVKRRRTVGLGARAATRPVKRRRGR
jgi:predicted DNA-binding ribbon-helix-helix protein